MIEHTQQERATEIIGQHEETEMDSVDKNDNDECQQVNLVETGFDAEHPINTIGNEMVGFHANSNKTY